MGWVCGIVLQWKCDRALWSGFELRCGCWNGGEEMIDCWRVVYEWEEIGFVSCYVEGEVFDFLYCREKDLYSI